MGVIPYEVGHTLTLQFVGDDATRSVYIEHVYGPTTMSVVLRVRLLDDPPNDCGLRNGDDAILKLHDRRFAVDMRTSPPYRAKEFDQELEDRYLEYLRNFNFDCESDQEIQNTPDRESEPTSADVETEADIQNRCLELAKAEEEIYHRLRPFQDRGQIPHYYAAVELLLDSHLPRLEDVPEKQLSAIQEYLRVPGALIEYVDGRPLREIGHFVPKDEWRYVIQSAMSTVNEWGDYDVLNSDVRLDNVLVQRLPNPLYEGMFLSKVVHFDFAQARIRAEDENDLDWKYSKWSEDEEGAIGVQMYALLGLTAFPQPGPGTSRYLGPYAYEDGVQTKETEDAGKEETSGKFKGTNPTMQNKQETVSEDQAGLPSNTETLPRSRSGSPFVIIDRTTSNVHNNERNHGQLTRWFSVSKLKKVWRKWGA